MDYLRQAEAIREQLVAHRRTIHQNAEVGFDLPKTTSYVAAQLREMGCEPQAICPGGIVATVGRPGGKTFLLRADMDALPMMEESGEAFASTTGACHACGHDLHTAMLLGAARLLKENEAALPGYVKLAFQPAEETFSGAQAMVKNGLLQNPTVDAAMAGHIASGHPAGSVFIHEGPVMSSCNAFSITVHGKGSHGAAPQQGVDPINIGAHIHLALQELIAREVPFTNAALLTIGKFHAGSVMNVLPDTAVLEGTLRTFNEKLRPTLRQRLVEIAQLTAQTFRGRADVDISIDLPPVVNDPALARAVRGYAETLLAGRYPVDDCPPRSGSEDFAFISEKVPGLMLFIGASDMSAEGEQYNMHHPKIRFDEEALVVGAALYAHAATRWLQENSR